MHLPSVIGCTPVWEIPSHIRVFDTCIRISLWTVKAVAIEAVGILIDLFVAHQCVLRYSHETASGHMRSVGEGEIFYGHTIHAH
jgi:hypothetical protein